MTTGPLGEFIRTFRNTVMRRDASGLSDGQLLKLFISRRDEAAFEALVRRHGLMVWGVCRRILHHHHDAEDAFQAAFIVLARKAASVNPVEMLPNWLYGVAFNIARKAKAKTVSRSARERLMAVMPEPLVEQPYLGDDVQRLLDQELSHLPEKYRVALVLCELEGKTYKEAAQQLSVSESVVSVRLVRARALLAKRLSRYGLVVSAAVLSRSAAPAAVPPSLIAATLRVAGVTKTAAATSVPAASLAEGVLKSMMLTKLKVAGAVAIGVAVASFGSTEVFYGRSPAEAARQKSSAAEKSKEQPNIKAQLASPREEPTKAQAADLKGVTRPVHLVQGHVLSVASSPDGRILVSGGMDRTVRVWDLAKSKEQSRWTESRIIRAVSLAPDGKSVASVSDDKQVNVWDTVTGRLQRTFRESNHLPLYIRFSPDGRLLASGGMGPRGVMKKNGEGTWGGEVTLWDLRTGKPRHVLRAENGDIGGIAFAPDGKTIAVGGRSVRLWDVTTGRLMKEIKPPEAKSPYLVNALAFTPDGTRLIGGAGFGRGLEACGEVVVWDARNGAVVRTFQGPSGPLVCIATSPDGKHVVGGSAGPAREFPGDVSKVVFQLTVWDLAAGTSVWNVESGLQGGSSIQSVAYAQEGMTVAVADNEALSLVDAATGKTIQVLLRTKKSFEE